MEFKIDTKPTYSHITPVSNLLDANLTAEINKKINTLTENGSHNYIIDLHNCLEADRASLSSLTDLHSFCYENEKSIVFTAVQDAVLQQIKEAEIDETINIAPTVIEAVDIISMEILERDLFKE